MPYFAIAPLPVATFGCCWSRQLTGLLATAEKGKGKLNTSNVLSEQRERTAQSTSETEARLARIWAELLKLEEVGIHDDYFALGGNSLLAVNLIARIEAQFGVKLPVTSIIEAPTVARLASLVESKGSHEPLILIREGGDKSPLFLVHDADGETILYRSLSFHLESGTHGLRAQAVQ